MEIINLHEVSLFFPQVFEVDSLRYASAILAVVVCCPSVCLSQVGVPQKLRHRSCNSTKGRIAARLPQLPLPMGFLYSFTVIVVVCNISSNIACRVVHM